MRVLIVTQGGGADLAPVESWLREQGHTVVTVTREAEVPAAWRSGTCALVMVDARTDPSRVPLVRALRSLPGGEESVLLLLGHRGALGGLRPVLEAGADDLLAWPVDEEELALRLELAHRRFVRREGRKGLPFGDDLKETLLAVSPVPTSITTITEGRVVAANEAYFELFGYTREEVIGRTTMELALWQAPLNRSQIVDTLRRHGTVRGVDAQYRTREGELRHTLLFMGLVPYGGTPHIIAFFPDITPLKRAEESLRRSEVSFRTLIGSLPDMVAVFDTDSRVRYANLKVATALGYESANELLGKHFSDIIPKEDFASANARMHEAIRTGRAAHQERRLLKRDGSVLHVESTTFPLPFDGEDSIVAVSHDLTERYQMQARLMLAQRMASVGTLAAGVAHEINNPLAYLTANLAFAREELTGVLPTGTRNMEPRLAEAVASAQAALAEAQQGADRVRSIVRDLKTFSRVDSAESEEVDVRQVLESTLNLATTEIRHRARLVKQLDAVPTVVGNESRLGQVFLNLLVNAAQAIPSGTPERHEIRVVTRLSGNGHVCVEVSDTGAGIAKEHLPRLFDPFFTTKEPGVGTGLGLSICHSLVTALGGEIHATSEPGRGSTFQVLLTPSQRLGTERPPPAPPPAPTEKRGSVLVVDDEPLVCTALGRTLRPHHDVTLFTRAQEALERIEAGERFDVVFCDLMMPGMSGMDFYSALQARHPEQAQRVIFLTGGAVTPQARAFLESVPSPHLEKPFAGRELLSLIQERLAHA
ncbi:putative sensory box histidine kinase/response regulator [Myxococcus xanthus DK 1622]|uniref:histidine kinase n=1 Tax=Myxococcus xanthus (strain DK1622) TaxID=246197 RepID=Q1D9R7_MYXXD|nr:MULTISPECIES: PAS domain S-box protein [Myxococcus]ABF86938.1 putative sensory box histidine kinase/response regulator [Myxococcus xanthus DK 1622]NOJ53894.1 PAS domain S-box protein [Myxococcus xanthus]QPM81908.1 PAS domain S-box protein [Myxococcus xanthus]QVW71157.1 PAS domain S-box protein [Myxococcus xanthus DZ2]QZZ50114.1 Sensor histidine kinase RcsC [Myxococcus xanthus]